MGTERNARPRPARRRFRHDSGVADRGVPANAGWGVLKIIADLIDLGIGTGHAVDAAEMAEPMTGLRQRAAHVPGAAVLGAARQRRHSRECQQIAGGVVEFLGGKSFWLALAERLCFRGVEAARGLHQRVKTAPVRPRSGVAIGAKRNVNNPRPQARDVLWAKTMPGDGAMPIALHENIGVAD